MHDNDRYGFLDGDDDDHYIVDDIVDGQSTMSVTISVLGCVVLAVAVLVIACCCCRRRRNQGMIIAAPPPPGPGVHYPQQQFVAVAGPVSTSPYPPVPPAVNNPYPAPYPTGSPYPAPYPTGSPYPAAGTGYPTSTGYPNNTGYPGGMPQPAAPTAPHCDVMYIPGPTPVPLPAAAGWAHHYSPAPHLYTSPPSYDQATQQQYEKHPPYNPHAPLH